MQCIISTAGEARWQSLTHEWYGQDVSPAFRYRFNLTPEGLRFHAARAAAALVHPEARPGCFHAGLWQYDVAEFFIAVPDASCYLEFNLSPHGAWWACVFSAPRVPHPGFPGWQPQAVAQGRSGAEGWECQALLPQQDLQRIGIDPRQCRLAACAILGSPRQVFLTSAGDCSGNPDFHLPRHWPAALCQM